MKVFALIMDTLREIYAKKVILGIIIIEVITLIITCFVLFNGNFQTAYRDAAYTPPREEQQAHSDSAAGNMSRREYTAEDSLLLELGNASDAEKEVRDTGGTGERDGFIGAEISSDSIVAEYTDSGKRDQTYLREMVKGQMGVFAAVIGLATLFLGIFGTASIVPSMMEKGTIDLLISKPISRATLLFGRTVGGVLALGVNLLLFNIAIYTLYGIASGIWHTPFILWTTLIPICAFIVLYSGIILLNVITGSWILPMSLAYVHMAILSNLLTARDSILYSVSDNEIFRGVVDGLYYTLPQISGFLSEVPGAVFTSSVSDVGPFIQGGIFTLVALSLAGWRFEKKDF